MTRKVMLIPFAVAAACAAGCTEKPTVTMPPPSTEPQKLMTPVGGGSGPAKVSWQPPPAAENK